MWTIWRNRLRAEALGSKIIQKGCFLCEITLQVVEHSCGCSISDLSIHEMYITRITQRAAHDSSSLAGLSRSESKLNPVFDSLNEDRFQEGFWRAVRSQLQQSLSGVKKTGFYACLTKLTLLFVPWYRFMSSGSRTLRFKSNHQGLTN